MLPWYRWRGGDLWHQEFVSSCNTDKQFQQDSSSNIFYQLCHYHCPCPINLCLGLEIAIYLFLHASKKAANGGNCKKLKKKTICCYSLHFRDHDLVNKKTPIRIIIYQLYISRILKGNLALLKAKMIMWTGYFSPSSTVIWEGPACRPHLTLL